MLSEELHAGGVADGKVAGHEDAAHEKRNWVRLTFDCNNKCVFCLDSDAHDGEYRDRDEVKQQIIDGRRAGATRLILSGGEPTIHPSFVDFVKLGRLAGYSKIQTVTNGRLFGYPEFLSRCLDAGLSEITFSLHGPNAKIHDALVGVKGAFEQEVRGLELALADGRPIVNVDVVINRANVKHLAEMLRVFVDKGVREFDLLQVVSFGNAFRDGRDILFYDLAEARPHLLEALEYAKRPDLHLWMNRFPPQHLEGFEHLIQDPYKLNDEVRGRKEEYARWIDEGEPLDCREPARCRYCYLESLCDTLERTLDAVDARSFDAVRVDTEWDAHVPPAFGGDPASSKRAKREADARIHLPVATPARRSAVPVPELVRLAGARLLVVRAPTLARAREAIDALPGPTELELELASWDGVASALGVDGSLFGRRLVRTVAASPEHAEHLLGLAHEFEVAVLLSKQTEAWLSSLAAAPSRLALRQPTWERLTESAEHDVDLRAFFARFPHAVPIDGVPACVTGRTPRASVATLDTTMTTADGRVEIFRFARRYVLDHYYTKSLRCRGCAHDSGCRGLHVNHVRARGYGVLSPVAGPAVAAAE